MAAARYSVFKAIADPTRRQIIHLLTTADEALTINDISGRFPASRQAVTKHLNILKQAGLLEIEKKGRERYCRPEVTPLQEVHEWISFYEQFWQQKLSDLEGFLANKAKTDDSPESSEG